MHIKTKAPARIDLAGGTLDLWPLYLFFENTTTINCAIDQFAHVELTVGPESKGGTTSSIELISEDRKASHIFKSYAELLESFKDSYKATALPSALWFHAKLVRHFFSFWRKSAPLRVWTHCAAPAGAGLGGSSALSIALCYALRKLTLTHHTDEELIDLTRDLETTVIDVPAGIQDYWASLFGGIQAIRMEAGRVHRKVFSKQADFIENHIILCYSGESRNSGMNNWAIYKGFIDGDKIIRTAFTQIVNATHRLEEALEKQDFGKFAESISQEWQARQTLAPTIATPAMLSVMDQAKTMGAATSKVCGAGGGGCFIIVAPHDKKQAISSKLEKQNVEVIPYKVMQEGCVLDDS